jgi:hypothetical protein
MLMECPICGGTEYLRVERRSFVETTDVPPSLVTNLGYREVSDRTAGEGHELDPLSE